MDQEIVTNAVRMLRSRGDRVSVRAVHGITGGSFRDVSRLLRDAQESLAEDEVAELDAEPPEPAPAPSLGRILEVSQSAQAAERATGDASLVLQEARERLQRLLRERPPPATNPHDVPDSVAARFEHQTLLAQLRDEVAQLEGIVQASMAESRTWRNEERLLRARAHELREGVLPLVRQQAADARQRLVILERDVAHQLEMARRQIVAIESRERAVEAELRELTGG